METFSSLQAICVGNSAVPGEFPAQRPVTRRFDVFFDLCLNKRMSKQPLGWWFEMPLCPLWRRFNDSIWVVLSQKQVSRAGTSNYIPQYLWDVITCPCPWYLLLAQHSSYIQTAKFVGPTWGPPWVLSAPDGPHVGPMNLAIRACLYKVICPSVSVEKIDQWQ